MFYIENIFLSLIHTGVSLMNACKRLKCLTLPKIIKVTYTLIMMSLYILILQGLPLYIYMCVYICNSWDEHKKIKNKRLNKSYNEKCYGT